MSRKTLCLLVLAMMLGYFTPNILCGQVKQGTEVIRLGPEATTRKTSFWSNSMVKTNILSPLFGIGQIEFEKELSDVISIQIGGGITFKKAILINERIKENFYELFVQRNFDGKERFMFSENFNEPFTSSQIGYAFSASTRFFVLGRGFEGFYLSPTVEYRHYNFQSQSIVPNRSQILRNPILKDKLYEKNTILSLRLGTQTTYQWLAIDYFAGIGIMYVNKHTQDLARNNQGNYTGELRTYKFNFFWPEIGFRIGYLLY